MSKMIKRILTMALALAMLVSYLPGMTLPARAAENTLTTSVDGLDVSYSDLIQASTVNGGGDAKLTATASGTTVEMTITGGFEYDSNYQRYHSMSTTLTLTNTQAEEARLTFLLEAFKVRPGSSIVLQYEGVTLVSSGEIELDDEGKIDLTTNTTASGNMEFVMPAHTSITFTMTSAKLTSKSQFESLKLSLRNLNLYVDEDIETTFKAVDPTMGSYTVDGMEITADQKITNKARNYYSLVATAADGYAFSGWYSEAKGAFISFEADASVQITENTTVYPVFIKAEDALWAVGDASFANVEDAIACAALSIVKEVALLKDYTLTDDLTIPAGITLLIPFDADNTCYTTEPETTPGEDPENDGSLNGPTPWEAPYAYRKLTLAEGVTITVNGGLSVSAQHSPGGQLTAGSPHGPCGFIEMYDDSQIVVNDDGGLYAWGYIVGSGTVTVNSGATVYENLQVTDFRGGSASGNMAQNKDYAVFPFSQYYVQNVEVPMTIHSGAAEVVYISIFAANSINSIAIDFIGTENAMFRMGEDAYVVKSYDGENDRLVVDTYGDVSLYALTVTHPMVGTVASSDFDLPITNNITINVNSGTTTINQNIALLPGAEVYVDADAVLVVAEGWNVYVYDADEWLAEKFVYNNLNVSPVAYSYANGTTKVRSNANLADAKIDVNGVMFVSGYLYTTEGGANICSSEGTGKVILWAGNGEADVTYQVTQNGTAVFYMDIPLTPAQLKNDNGTYTDTSEADSDYGEAYYYNPITGTWDTISYVVYVTNGGDAIESEEHFNIDIEWTLADGEEYLIELPGFDDNAFLGWDIDGDGEVDYEAGEEIAIRGNVTLYAIWEVQTFDVYVDGEKFAELDFGANLAGLLAALEEPTKSGHIFAGWVMTDAEGNVYTGTTMPAFDVYITASWTEIKKVTYTYLDKDGNELKSELVEEGSAANYPDVPAIIETTYYTYTFEKWVAEADEAGNVTYTATYTATAKTFHITYMDGDALFTEDQADDTNNWTVETPAPTKEGYNFLGWATEQNGEAAYQAGEKIALTADLTLYAVWEEEIVYYTVTINGNDIPVKYGDIFTLPASTENRTGYSFAGWYVSGNSDVIYQPGDTYTVTEDVTFEAKWTINQYNLCFYVNGTLIGTLAVDYQTRIDQTYLNYNGPAVNVEGYSLVEWRTDTWGNRSFYMPNYDVKLYASLTVNSYKLTWIIDGVENSSYVEYGSTLTAPAPTKDAEGCIVYTFSGWDKEIPATMPAENLTFTGSFIESTVHTSTEVTYTNNGDDTHSATHDCCGGEYVTNESHTYDETTHACVCGAESHAHDHYVVDGDIHQSVCSCGKLLGEDEHTYVFEENDLTCACVCGDGYNGICTAETGIYWIENGIAVENKGLVRVVENGEAYYYYFEGYTAVTNGVYWVENSNDLLPKWDYTFGADGVIEHDDALNNEEQQNHEISVYDGIKYYTIDGIKVHYGLFEMDGAYYYARRDGSLVCGKTYWITDTNGLMEEGSYTFDAEGRMIMDGIVGGYYYVKGVRTYAGLIKIDGAYYYVRTSGQIATGKYWITKTNGLMPQGSYEFDADGKMLNAPAEMPGVDEAFTGIKDGYYYENGKLTYAGLIELDGKFYYVRTSGQVATGRYWITKTNGLMEAGSYLFGADGAMIVE